MKRSAEKKKIEVWAHWLGLKEPRRMGLLFCLPGRGKETFSFEYERSWLASGLAQNLDPSLRLYPGPQYAPEGKENFGIFLDSAPDRWGRLLMKRREERRARELHEPKRDLKESDFLLGVYDGHRMGALRFRLEPQGPFLSSETQFAAPPWTSLRELENASLQLEKEGAEDNPQFGRWIQMLLAPGASLGGARPKASVLDEKANLWIAKFPSLADSEDKGAWEAVAHQLALQSGVDVSPAQTKLLSAKHHTFLTKRFDRTAKGERIHFASAITLLQRNDGDGAAEGASYLEIAEFLARSGAQADKDLERLWRRIVFNICISNIDDHLRNHGCLLGAEGWSLSPAYDLNPSAVGEGLTLNISEADNAQDLRLALEVTPYFRVKHAKAKKIIEEVVAPVKKWRAVAGKYKIPGSQQKRMERAFRVAEKWRG